MSRTSLNRCASNNTQECITCVKQAGWIAVYANFALALFKAFIGYISGSQAILGDALFSFKDFIASLVVVIGVKVSGKPADDQHPYGHGKIEFVALFHISLGLIVGTILLFAHSAKGIWYCFNGSGASSPGMIAFWAALISVAANYKLAQFLNCVGDKIHSPSILANARHNNSDAVSSIMVALAVLGARYLGLQFLDPLVALIEAVCLMGMSVEMLSDALKGLFDFAAHPEAVGRIESIARVVPGVRKVSRVVARQRGQGIWVDMTINVDADLKHQEGYIVSQHVKKSIRDFFGENTEVNVIIEPFFS